ncbi:hypothetical protein EDC39_102145 [Geothermobacter ehrlichii]|uniref:Tetratricopeptide repeat protein n=1 Tax=Geothermobacter ehrlichii TaxID=213224 RepID=A0A5D3WLN2_9BACT|nr:hypothetical protein [Geothermobacter ehrlichii]TYO99622.1 hypothetical protein EDC39_102145 [Geothermobacter ehrlichii]
MKLSDRFDLFHLLMLALALGGALVLGFSGSGSSAVVTGTSRQLEQDLAYRARIAFLRDVYAPVEELMTQGRDQQALLKLAEIARRYPGEGYGLLLRGRILHRLGAVEQAAAAYAEAVRKNPDFVDAQAPLSARQEIAALLETELQPVRQRAVGQGKSPSARRALSDLRYLQSRLAGGCE